MADTILFAGGGTGGHLYPALAMADECRDRGYAVRFVGTRDKIEATKVPQAGYPIEFIWISGFHRRLTLKNLTFPIKLLVSLWQSRSILKRHRPVAVVGTGGYVCGPILWWAVKLNIPVFVQEQNAVPGVTTRTLAGEADTVFLAYDAAAEYIRSARTLTLGNPVRDLRSNDTIAAARARFNLEDRPTIGVFGGSLGSRAINEGVAKEANQFGAYNLIWQTGSLTYGAFSVHDSDRIRVLPYIDDMRAFYRSLDIIICRAGAISLSEIALIGLPAVIIPLPGSAGNHQEHNARTLAEAGAAVMLAENELPARLATTVIDLMNDADRRLAMSQAALKFAKPDAVQAIVNEIEARIRPENGVSTDAK